MNPETVPASDDTELETAYEIHNGDVLFVTRNLKSESGHPLRDAEGKQQKQLEDGWEVVDLKGIHPVTGQEGVMLRNTNNQDEIKFYSESQLRTIQEQAEADIVRRASSVASEMLGEIDQRSAEIAEEEPRVTEEQAEKIGEEVLEVAEIDEPAPSAEEPGHSEDSRADNAESDENQEQIDQLTSSISEAINYLEGEGQSVALGRRTIVENIRISIAQLGASVRHYDDYSTASMRTILQRTAQDLHGVEGAALRYSEGTINDVLKYLESAETAVNTSGNIESISAQDLKNEMEGAESIKADLRHAGHLVGELRGKDVRRSTGVLEEMIRESHFRQLDISEVQQIVRALETLAADGGELDLAIQKAGQSLDRAVQNLRNVRSKLSV